MADEEKNYIQKIKLPSDETYYFKDDNAWHKENNHGNLTIKVGGVVKGTTYNPETADQTIDITASDLKITEVMRFKGTKSYDQIKLLTDAEMGDVWLDNTTGIEYICVVAKTTGDSAWEKLGFDIDLSGYVEKTDFNAHTHSFGIPENKVVTSGTSTYLSAELDGDGVTIVSDSTNPINAITAINPTSGYALGSNTEIALSGAPTTKYIKATTSTGVALNPTADTNGIRPVTSVGMPTTVTDSTWNFTLDPSDDTCLVISGSNGTHTDGTAPTLGTAKSYLTAVSVQTQPVITLSALGSSEAGTAAVLGDLGDVAVSVGDQRVDVITGFDDPTTTNVAVKIGQQAKYEIVSDTTGDVAVIASLAKNAVTGLTTGTPSTQL